MRTRWLLVVVALALALAAATMALSEPDDTGSAPRPGGDAPVATPLEPDPSEGRAGRTSTDATRPPDPGRCHDDVGWPQVRHGPWQRAYEPCDGGPRDGAHRLWNRSFAGGFLRPIAVNDTLYVRAGSVSSGGQDEEPSPLRVLAIDASTGRTEAEHEIRDTQRSLTPPVYGGGRLYLGDGKGQLRGISASTGERAWIVDLSDGSYFDDNLQRPTVYGERLYVMDRQGMVYAVDAETGRELWSERYAAPENAASGSPSVRHGKVFVGRDNGSVVALDGASGREVWRSDVETRFGTTVAVGENHVFVEGEVVGPSADEGGGDALFAVDLDDGSTVWRHPMNGTVWPDFSVGEGGVYAPLSNGSLLALDTTTGAVRWVLDPQWVDDPRSPSVANGTVYVGWYDGWSRRTVAINAATGSMRWHIDAASAQAPLVDGTHLYLPYRGENRLTAVGPTSAPTARLTMEYLDRNRTTVRLHATGSSGGDSALVRYVWHVTRHDAVVLDRTTQRPRLDVPIERSGPYTANLTVVAADGQTDRTGLDEYLYD